jgi:E3 ubiquitin-protein ligase SIAH1
VPCGYERYGCDAGGVVYHEAADHRRACHHAPCYCPDRAGAAGVAGCGFTGSRQMLLDHISGPDHSRPIIVVRYGQPWNLNLPLSRRWHVLVGEEDKAAAAPGSDRHRNLFLVSLGERGATTAVSLVCVRADGTAPVAPQFACKLAVEHSGDGTRLTLESPLVSSSSLAGGVPAPGEVKCLPVPKDFLSGDSVPLSIHIEKLAPPPSLLTSTPPTAATRPPCPAGAILSLPASATAAVKAVTTDQSNKKRKSTNPRKLKTICMSDLV